jgi:hypothetical protein
MPLPLIPLVAAAAGGAFVGSVTTTKAAAPSGAPSGSTTDRSLAGISPITALVYIAAGLGVIWLGRKALG